MNQVRVVLQDSTIGFQPPSLPSFSLGYEGFEGHVLWEHDCVNSAGNAFRSETILPYRSSDGWVLVTEEPMTVTPSVLCKTCNTHGFITNGKWTPA